MCHHAPVVFYNRRHLRIYNFNSTFLVDVIGVKAFAYIFLYPWAERSISKSLDHSRAHGLLLSGMRAEVSVRVMSRRSSSARRSFCFPNV